jgi:hypothetical protein
MISYDMAKNQQRLAASSSITIIHYHHPLIIQFCKGQPIALSPDLLKSTSMRQTANRGIRQCVGTSTAVACLSGSPSAEVASRRWPVGVSCMAAV